MVNWFEIVKKNGLHFFCFECLKPFLSLCKKKKKKQQWIEDKKSSHLLTSLT
jgi:hypothetical protein